MPVTPKAQATAARISGVAARLFLENGYTETPVADVAAEAGVAAGTVLLHFGSKSELATAAFSVSISDVVSTAVSSVPETSARQQVNHVVGLLFQWYEVHQTIAPVLLKESLFSTGPAARQYTEAVARTVGEFQTFCQAGQDRGELSPQLDPALMAEGLLADYLLVLLQGLRGNFTSIEEQVEHFDALTNLRWQAAMRP